MMRLGLFRIGRIHFAVPLRYLCKIWHRGAVFTLPRLPQAMPQVLLEGGRLYPLLSLEALATGSEARLPGCAEYQVVVESEAGRYALPAEQNYGIIYENKGHLQNAEGDSGVRVVGEFSYNGLNFQVLDVDRIALGLT